jgi:hypothetical protein
MTRCNFYVTTVDDRGVCQERSYASLAGAERAYKAALDKKPMFDYAALYGFENRLWVRKKFYVSRLTAICD